MSNEIKILEQLNELSPNQVYAVSREDGQVISVTSIKSNIPLMIREEYCQAEISLYKLEYNKQEMNHTLYVELVDADDNDEIHIFEFTIATVRLYGY